MDDFQFIIESPQSTQGHKKRPRLVTSCDNCRLKKIKCLQTSAEGKCEACKLTKIPCRFRDRERYFAERSRAIAGPNAPQAYDEQHSERSPPPPPEQSPFSTSGSSRSSMSSHSEHRSHTNSPQQRGVVAPDMHASSRYQPYPPETQSRSMSPAHRHAGPRADLAGYHVNPGSNAYARLPPIQNRQIALFDPQFPQRPHPSLMQHLIQGFFEYLGSDLVFISHEDVMREYWDHTLPPLLANCIAATASRYSKLPELTVRGLHNVMEAYADNAKIIAASIAHIPDIETLHGLMILAYSEYKSSRNAEFQSFCHMSMRMAMELGMSQNTLGPPNLPDRERSRRRVTWASLMQLQMTASAIRSS